MKRNEPLTINVHKKDIKRYEDILNKSILKGRSNKEIFFLAMAVGYKNGHKMSIKGNKKSYVRTEYLNDEDWTILNAIAIEEAGNPDVINNKKEVINIVEEYAHAGLIKLKEMIFEKNTGSFLKKFEGYLRDCLSSK